MATQNNTTEHQWKWFTDKVLPQLFVALVLAVSGGLWFTYKSVNDMASRIDKVEIQAMQNTQRISTVESNMVTQNQLLETMKRVEQQLEIMMLRAGMKSK